MCNLSDLLINQLDLPINDHSHSLQIRLYGILNHIILIIPKENSLNDLSRGDVLVVDSGDRDGDLLQSR